MDSHPIGGKHGMCGLYHIINHGIQTPVCCIFWSYSSFSSSICSRHWWVDKNVRIWDQRSILSSTVFQQCAVSERSQTSHENESEGPLTTYCFLPAPQLYWYITSVHYCSILVFVTYKNCPPQILHTIWEKAVRNSDDMSKSLGTGSLVAICT